MDNLDLKLCDEARAIIEILDLAPHPEGGFYKETFRDSVSFEGRAASTAIHFLLAEGQSSHWHRVDAVEIWHWHKGAPLALSISDGTMKGTTRHILGNDITAGEQPQIIVPKGAWQTARSLGPYTLTGCTVAPGFMFEGFEMAPADWTPR